MVIFKIIRNLVLKIERTMTFPENPEKSVNETSTQV